MRVNAINDHHRSAIFLSFLSSYHSSEPHTKIDRLFERFCLVFVCVCVCAFQFKWNEKVVRWEM